MFPLTHSLPLSPLTLFSCPLSPWPSIIHFPSPLDLKGLHTSSDELSWRTQGRRRKRFEMGRLFWCRYRRGQQTSIPRRWQVHSMIWYDMTWYDMIWHDMIWHDMTWYDMIWHDMTWHDMIWHDMIWHDMIWYDMTWYDMTWYDRTWYDMTWHDVTWYDMIWHDMTWHDMIWHDMTRQKMRNGSTEQCILNNDVLVCKHYRS